MRVVYYKMIPVEQMSFSERLETCIQFITLKTFSKLIFVQICGIRVSCKKSGW